MEIIKDCASPIYCLLYENEALCKRLVAHTYDTIIHHTLHQICT